MRKQGRRLWFGDWQPGEEPAVSRGDTFEIVPEDDDPTPKDRDERRGKTRLRIAALAVIAIFGALGFVVASRDDQKPVAQTQVPPAQIPQAQPSPPPQGFGGPDLTGPDAAKAAAAALAKYPGTIERVTRGAGGGGYVVHVIEPDGNEVHVLVDRAFRVEGSDAPRRPPKSTAPGTSQ